MKKIVLWVGLFFQCIDTFAQRIIPLDFSVAPFYSNQGMDNDTGHRWSLRLTNISPDESLWAGDTVIYLLAGSEDRNILIFNTTVPPGQDYQVDSLPGFTSPQLPMQDEVVTLCVQILGTANTSLHGSWSNPFSPLEECVQWLRKDVTAHADAPNSSSYIK